MYLSEKKSTKCEITVTGHQTLSWVNLSFGNESILDHLTEVVQKIYHSLNVSRKATKHLTYINLATLRVCYLIF